MSKKHKHPAEKPKKISFHSALIFCVLLIVIAAKVPKVLAAPGCGSSIIHNNPDRSKVDMETSCVNAAKFMHSDSVTADATDLAKVTYKSKQPVSAVINGSNIVTFTFNMTDIGTDKSGDFTIDAGTLKDGSDDPNALITITDGNVTDGAAPVIKSFNYSDEDGDGKIDRFFAVFSETITAESHLCPNDFNLTNVGDFTGAAFGSDNMDIISGNAAAAFVNLGTEAAVFDTREDSGNIAVSAQNDFALSDGSNTSFTTGAQTQVTFGDIAYPVTIFSSSASSSTTASPIPVTVQFSENISGFAESDLIIGNGLVAAGSFSAASQSLYTFNMTPAGQGAVTVDIAAGAAQDASSNGNVAATQLSRTYDTIAPVISGVENGATYNADVAPTFNEGTATLNGASFSSGETISANGDYTLTVTDAAGNSETVRFTVKKFSTDTPTLAYSQSKRAKKRINVTFYGQSISTKKKWVTTRLGGKKVKVMAVRSSGSDLIIAVSVKYKKWPTGSYTLSASYKSKTGKRSWQKGTLTAENVLAII